MVYSQDKSSFPRGENLKVWHTQLSAAELYKIPKYELTYTKQLTDYSMDEVGTHKPTTKYTKGYLFRFQF